MINDFTHLFLSDYYILNINEYNMTNYYARHII